MRLVVLSCGLTTWLAACAVGTGGPTAPLDAAAESDAGARAVDAATTTSAAADGGTASDTPPGHATTDDPEQRDQPHDAGTSDAALAALDSGASQHDAATGADAATEPDAAAATDAGAHTGGGASTPDAAASDAATPEDASTPDAELPDAELPDADAPDAAAAPDAEAPDSGAAALPTCDGPPGLFADTHCQVLAPGVEAFHPQYPLWSDGAKKDRYIYLPPGTRIDTSNPDRWSFPVGTRLYKTFAAGDTKVETRVLEKVSAATGFSSWTAVSYLWSGSAEHESVSLAPSDGLADARGTSFDIPSQAQCKSCHNMTGADAVIGFNALQLNHADGGLTLAELLDRDLLVNGTKGAPLNISLANSQIPGDALSKAALGYLHGNCGHCHGGPSPRAGQRLWSVVGVTQLGEAPIFESAVCECIEGWTGRTNPAGDPYVLRVAPSHAAVSGIIGRMSSRTPREQMPPLGTELVDSTGLATVKAWIDSLEGTTCEANPPVCGG